jgi:hypothetical protein
VEIDIRGQVVSETTQNTIKQQIVQKSNGIIKLKDVNFITENK